MIGTDRDAKTVLPDFAAWSSYRARINHDEIANSLLPLSIAVSQTLNGKVLVSGGLPSLKLSLASSWPRTRSRIEYLLDASADLLRPSAMIQGIEGVVPDGEIWQELLGRLDARWLSEYSLETRSSEIRGLLRSISEILQVQESVARFDFDASLELSRLLRSLSDHLSRLESDL